MSEGITIFFDRDISEVEGNPFHMGSPFGRASIVARGNVFQERDEVIEAIEFALAIDDHYDMREFLKGWVEGDTREWPEFQPRNSANSAPNDDLPTLAASIMGAARHYTHDHETALKITRMALYQHDADALLATWRADTEARWRQEAEARKHANSEPKCDERVEADPYHRGRWSVVDANGLSDGWSYPSREAAEEALAARNHPIQGPTTGCQPQTLGMGHSNAD